jgi:hypothetical protein
MSKVIAICLLSCLLVGCIHFTDKSGTRHYLIVGIGVVSVSKTNQPIQVVKESMLGIDFQTLPFKCAIGVDSIVEMRVETNVNVVVEIQNLPLKPFKIEVQK